MRLSRPALAAIVTLLPGPCPARPKVAAPVAPPDIVARFHAAHSIWVVSADLKPDVCVLPLYQAIAAWPGVSMADSPAHADVILEPGIVTIPKGKYPTPVNTFLHILLIDPSTQSEWSHVDVLWNRRCPELVRTALAYYVPPDPNPKPLKIAPPLPAQLRRGGKLYLQSVVLVPAQLTPDRTPVLDFDPTAMLTQAIAGSGLYSIVDSPSGADLILTATIQPPDPLGNGELGDKGDIMRDAGIFRMDLLDPKTKILLLHQKNFLVSSRGTKTTQQRFAQTLPYILKDWTSYATKAHL